MCWAGLTALALTLSAAPVRAAKTTYQDVDEGAWYAASVAFCQQHELMEGASSGSFEPDGLLTRGTLAEALYRLAGSPAPEGEEEAPFTDVGAEHPNVAAIRWAKADGVVSGYEDGSFGPEDPITREQIAALLWNDRGREEPGASAPYTDRAEVSDWAAGAVEWAYGVRLMQGTPEGAFLPQSNTSRAQGAVVIMNYAQMYYGLRPGYQLPAPSPVAANGYRGEAYALDDRGYLSYSAGPFTRGVDVSAHQKEVDWRRVAATGMDFAMIRAGYRGYTSGGIVKDAWFDANMRGALANGLQVGVYFFSQALTPREAEEEARQLLEWIRDYPVTYPVVFDWEEQDKEGSRTQGTDGNTVTACALAFCKVIEDAGYLPMTYGSPRKVYSGGIQLEYLQDYPFWLAHYTKDTAPTSFRYNYQMWQYSSTGQVDGIEGNVDLNICLTSWTDWKNGGHAWWIGPV
jgi:GH25 family lysozyme M1 (1,4-beta-N-acetylmuramidase)